MANFLFIHGGMHGAWCWVKVIDILETGGHHCLDMDLPGAGLDRTPRKDVTFDTYLEKIDHFIEVNDLKDINLVGHSIAGMLLPQIALDERTGVYNIIFLVAYVPDVGQSIIDLMPENRKQLFIDEANKSDEGSFLADYENARNLFFSDLDEESAKNYYSLLTPQPLEPCQHKSDVELSSIEQSVHYIICKKDRVLPNDLSIEFIKKLNCDVHEIDSGHDVMLSHPKELAELLEKIAK